MGDGQRRRQRDLNLRPMRSEIDELAGEIPVPRASIGGRFGLFWGLTDELVAVVAAGGAVGDAGLERWSVVTPAGDWCGHFRQMLYACQWLFMVALGGSGGLGWLGRRPVGVVWWQPWWLVVPKIVTLAT
ncbi:hypothetical protein Dimus_005211 [Dionaea muscipula]